MGYFSNGTEGMRYEEEYCEKCIHYGTMGLDDCGDTCAVWDLHMQYNYEECNKPESFLHVLIPHKDGQNEQCRMFIERPAPKFCDGQKELF